MKDFIRKHRKIGVVSLLLLGFGLGGLLLNLLLRGVIVLPETWDLGFVVVRGYSVVLILSLLSVVVLFQLYFHKFEVFAKVDIWELLLYVLIPGIVGARVYHVLTDYYIYADNPIYIVALWSGGLGIIGGIVGGVVGLIAYSKVKKVSLLALLGAAAMLMPVAQAIGRGGNFVNRELYGLPTDLPWGLYVPVESRLLPLSHYPYYHPLFLYEALANILLFILILYLWKRRKSLESGWVTNIKVYLLGYAAIRFVLDFLRLEGGSGAFGFTYAQLTIAFSLVTIVLFGVIYQVWYKRKHGVWFTK